jgi:hypothetical protein
MDTEEQTEQKTSEHASQVLLIDLENCPNQQLQQLLTDVANYSQIVICYAQNTPRIPLDLLMPLAAVINAEKLKIIRMERGGKNSADFGICFFAGMLTWQLPQNTHFIIVSNDSDLDHTVSLLKSQGRTAERIGTRNKEEELKEPEACVSPLPGDPQKIYCEHLIKYQNTRPAKKNTLLNSIKSKLNGLPVQADSVLHFLQSAGAIQINNNQIAYNDKKIKELAGAK